ncbi:growth arrest specific 2 like 2 [Rhinolophus ferrumequinum]|uniref:Growth arrest specific 2 like 2 n=1 Tax=Rhinolophus ferrumequinum TaxID=59479 RepID=A0A671G777_RHIFE|nr:GAS2-like protein 2 [Rhinolophus ferrumequinum]KAF6298596.1 growth arrest specific 2 like 2 [Rhinolophus ferrumequinum]
MSQPEGRGRRPGTPGPPVRSIRPFKSSEQYLEAMKEDLAEWLRDLYGLDIDAANFLQVLETGAVLCQHANAITAAALAFLAEAPARAQRIPIPQAGVSCNGAAHPGTFQARDNVSNFIQWCRKEMGIQEVLMFETEDLVLRKNVKNVVLCLLELGHRAWRFGVAAPTLVQLEEEIEQELRQELALPPPESPLPTPPTRRLCHFRNLDQMVQSLVSHCTCPVQFSMVKVSEGKYRVGDSDTLIFIRVLRNHVMVRVGGGWDTLGHYLDKHDPCRCTSLSHKPGSFLKPPVPPVQHEVRVQDEPWQPQPTMTISRSQSPLPPVDWKTYTSSGQKLRPPASSSPIPRREWGAGAGVLRETAPFLRCQERPPAPCRRHLPAGDSSPIPQSSPTHRGRDPRCTSSRKREDRCTPELPRGRTPTSWVHEEPDNWGTHARAPTPQRLWASEATSKGIPARGPSPPPRSSSLAQLRGPRQPPWGEVEGTSSQFRERASVRSPSPVKGPTKIPVRLPAARPPTPGRSFPGTASGGPTTELGRSFIPLRATTGVLAGSRHGDCSVEGRQGVQKLDIRVTAEAGESWDLGPLNREGRYTPLPLEGTKEQAIYHSLEEELLANMKLLEVGAACPQGPGSGVIPRSGVYVPSLGGRWPEPGGPYDRVIQELAQGPPPLIKVDLGAWKTAPTGSPKLAVTTGPGSPKGKPGARDSVPRPKASLSAKGTRMRKVPTQGGQDCSDCTVSASPEDPTPSPSNLDSDKAKACLGKGKRTLRKPQRVPSIYKLKLRPRIRPRRDHRPEKRPSRIPKPLAYLRLRPARVPPSGRPRAAALGSKGGEAALVNGAWAGEKEEGKERKQPAAALESSPQPLGDLGTQQLDQVPLLPEEESWV